MAVSDAAKLRAVTDENAKLKRILANSILDNIVLKNLLGKN
jgi:putative transposase